MLKFFSVPWSLHCVRAEELLREANVSFEKVELTDNELFAAAPQDLGLHRLPALRGGNVFCEGLTKIEEFVNKMNIKK